MRVIACAALAAALFASSANARCFVIVGRGLVERSATDASGHQQTVLRQTNAASPGDRLVFQFDYRNARPDTAGTMVVTNPVPAQLVYAGSDTPGETVSVDGGRSFGMVAELKVVDVEGLGRPGMPDDVTHVRWVKHDLPSGSGGQLSFRAVMRDVDYVPSREVQMAMR